MASVAHTETPLDSAIGLLVIQTLQRMGPSILKEAERSDENADFLRVRKHALANAFHNVPGATRTRARWNIAIEIFANLPLSTIEAMTPAIEDLQDDITSARASHDFLQNYFFNHAREGFEEPVAEYIDLRERNASAMRDVEERVVGLGAALRLLRKVLEVLGEVESADDITMALNDFIQDALV